MIRTLVATAARPLLLLNRYQDLVYVSVDPDGALAAKRPANQYVSSRLSHSAGGHQCHNRRRNCSRYRTALRPVLVHNKVAARDLILRSSLTGLLFAEEE